MKTVLLVFIGAFQLFYITVMWQEMTSVKFLFLNINY